MFGWWKNNKKTSTSTSTLTEAQLAVIQNFQTDELPVALGELLLDLQLDGDNLKLQLPFAAQSIVPLLLEQLSAVGFNGQLTLTAVNELPATLATSNKLF